MSEEATAPEAVVTVADRLRVLADWLDAHPSFEPSQIDTYKTDIEIFVYGAQDAAAVEEMAKAAGGLWEKDASSDLFRLRQTIMPGFRAEICAMRDRVCKRVVIGTREVEVPDPEAPTVTREEEIVEWRCEPLLAKSASAPAAPSPLDEVPF